MKSDKEILATLRKLKEAKIELKKYISWIEQIKLEFSLSVQSERQVNYYRQPLQTFDTNKVKGQVQQTNDSSIEEVQVKCNQMTFQSQQQDINQDKVRDFIERYEKMLGQQDQEQQPLSSQNILIVRDSKQQFGTSTIEEMFKLSQSQQESQQNNQSSYDTSNFGNEQQSLKKQKEENLFNNLMNYSKECEQEQSIQSSKYLKDYLGQDKVDSIYLSKKQQQQQPKKSFEQFYQEHVEEEIQNIQNEIEDMNRFLERVQTAKEKLTNSFKDLQQIPIIKRQSSESSILKVTEDLKLIDLIKQNMIKFMENNVDQDKLKKLRNMKHQIQLYFNHVEDELLKINEETQFL